MNTSVAEPVIVDASQLWRFSAADEDVLTNAFAHVIAVHCNPDSRSFVPALGLDYKSFIKLLQTYFPLFIAPSDWLLAQKSDAAASTAMSEFPDLLQLLLDYSTGDDDHHRRIAHLVASACMSSNHLWQDLGLPDRKALSSLLSDHFPALAARNTGNMKWKKFFYKQLCDREGVNACKAPSCAACDDYSKCFGAEE